MPVPQCLGSGRVMGGFPFAYAPQPPRKPHRTERRTQRGTRHEVDLEKAAKGAQRRLAESRADLYAPGGVRSARIGAQTLEPANFGLLCR